MLEQSKERGTCRLSSFEGERKEKAESNDF
jgi:hypothetical protein